MKLVLNDTKYLKEPVMIISELVNEATFKVDGDKIELIAMDPGNVAMVIFKLLSSAFVEYDVSKKYDLAISLEMFKQILRRAKPSDTLTLKFDEEKNRLNVLLKGETSRHFTLSLIDVDDKEQKVPSLKFPVKVSMNTLLLTEAVEDMDIISDSVNLMIDNDMFIIQSEGNISSGRVEINKDGETDIFNEGDDSVKSKYSLEYMKKIVKGAKLANSVSLYFGKDYPLKTEYKITDKLLLQFILAPRVADN